MLLAAAAAWIQGEYHVVQIGLENILPKQSM